MHGIKKKSGKLSSFLRVLGPGLITGASDDDPSGITTYSQAGARFGYATLWTAFITFPLMAAIQGMCARIGIVTQEGLAGTLRKNYHRSLVYLMILFSFPAIVFNIGADIQGMGAVANLICPPVPASLFSLLFTLLLLFCIIRFPYHRIARVLKWLCLSLFLYIIVPFCTNTDWKEVAQNLFIPSFRFDREYLLVFVAILGTTISPYLFFWQATMQVEDLGKNGKKIIVDKHILSDMKKDVNTGMLFSNLVMFFLMLTAGSVLHNKFHGKIETVDQIALALEPALGDLSYYLFAIGIIGTGLIAIPVLAGTISYMMAEVFRWEQGLDKAFHEAKGFYICIGFSLALGLALDLLHIDPLTALFYTAVLYGLTAPFMVAIILHISNNKKIMGRFTNGFWYNILGGLAFLLLTGSAIVLLYFEFSGK